jgi:hypothetical protein
MKTNNSVGALTVQAWFFARNLYLSPVANPLFAVLCVPLAVLAVARDLTLPDILAAMFILAIGTRGPLRTGGGSLRPFLALLPLSGTAVLRLLLISSIVYGVLVQCILTGVLAMAVRGPDIPGKVVGVVTTPAGESVSIVGGYVADLDGAEVSYADILRPSLLFGIARSSVGWPGFPAWPFLLPLLYTCATVGFTMGGSIRAMSPPGQARPGIPTARLALGIVICLGTLTDFVLADSQIWKVRSWLDNHTWMLPVLCAAVSLGFVILTGVEYRRTRRELRGGAHVG